MVAEKTSLLSDQVRAFHVAMEIPIGVHPEVPSDARARQEFGINGEPIANLVHAANMTKASREVRSDGKRLKPVGFVLPDIAGELRRQGWDPNAGE